MTTLAEFLQARVKEDEAMVRFRTPQLDIGTKRWLAECEAKRRIIDWIVFEASRIDWERGDCHTEEQIRNGECHDNGDEVAQAGLRLLALPYADHPDYRQEWRV